MKFADTIAYTLGGICVAAGALLAGCTDAQVAKLIAVSKVTCAIDGVIQPTAVSLAPFSGSTAVQVATLDDALVHPIVKAACASIGAIPAAVSAAP